MTTTISSIISKFNKYYVKESQNEFTSNNEIIKFLKKNFSFSLNGNSNNNGNDNDYEKIDSDLLNKYRELHNYLTKCNKIDDINTLVLITQSFFYSKKKSNNNNNNTVTNTKFNFAQLYDCIVLGIQEYFRVKLTEMKNPEDGIVLLEYKKTMEKNNIDYNIKIEYFKKQELYFTRKTRSCSKREQRIAERKSWKPFNIKINESVTTFENIPLEINSNLNDETITNINTTNYISNTETEITKSIRTGIKCRTCGIIGHFTYDCPNTQSNNLLNTKKSFDNNNNNTTNTTNNYNNTNNKYSNSNQKKTYSVIVNHISSESTVDEITEHFSEAGRIQRVTIPKGNDGTNRNFCFVNFYSEESVDRAIKKFNGTGLNSMIMIVEKAKNKY